MSPGRSPSLLAKRKGTIEAIAAGKELPLDSIPFGNAIVDQGSPFSGSRKNKSDITVVKEI